MTKPNPLPWRRDGHGALAPDGSSPIEFMPYEGLYITDTNMDLILKSVNLHDRLVEALEEIVEDIPRINKKEFYRTLLKEARGVK